MALGRLFSVVGQGDEVVGLLELFFWSQNLVERSVCLVLVRGVLYGNLFPVVASLMNQLRIWVMIWKEWLHRRYFGLFWKVHSDQAKR